MGREAHAFCGGRASLPGYPVRQREERRLSPGETAARVSIQALRPRVGSWRQVAGIDLYTAASGPEAATRILLVRTPHLALECLPDRALDIGRVWWRGVQVAWISPVGFPSPHRYEPEGTGWLRSFGGGFLTTCGLDNVGAPSQDEGRAYGLHGRIGNTPAEWLAWEDEPGPDRWVLRVRGRLRQTSVFGEHLVLHRTLEVPVDEPRFSWEDEVVNEGFSPTPVLLLYHVNLGYPLIAEDTACTFPEGRVTPRDEDAAAGLAVRGRGQLPTPGMREQVFRYDPAVDACAVTVERPGGFGMTLAYSRQELPILWQWRMLGEGTYVMGIEPANTTVLGRAAARTSGEWTVLEPGERRRYRVEVHWRGEPPRPMSRAE